MQPKILSKTTNAIISKSGAGASSTTRIGIPAEWARAIGITKDDKKVTIEFVNNNEIVIRKVKN